MLAPPLPAGAQEFPDPNDFTDPVTGEFDVDAYLAALNAGQENGGDNGGALPRTGSDVDSAVAAGVALVAVGGATVLITRRRRADVQHTPA